MKKLLLLCTLITFYSAMGQSSYQKVWENLNQNKWNEASTLLNEAEKDPATAADAYITRLYLKSYMGREDEVKDFATSFYIKTETPYPYIYALWFNESVIGPTGKKIFSHQISLLDKLLADPKTHGTLYASVNHQLGMHNLFSNKFAKSKEYLNEIGNLRNWQFAGPFENISKTGFYKDYGTLKHPEPTAIFKSITNADVKWFAPATEIQDGWTPVDYQFGSSTAVAYAQTFVNSNTDQTLYCAVGSSGSIKVWINDELVIAESEERTTELDTYISSCHLKKGINRVLVQLGFTNNSYPNFSIRFTDDVFRPAKDLTSSPVYEEYPRATEMKKISMVTPFAEKFFKDRINSSPNNLVNYLLLADVYQRQNKVIEARTILSEAIKKAPENCLLKMKMAEVLIKEDNRTLLLEEVEKIKKLDPRSLLVMDLNLKELLKNQKYEEVSRELEKRIQLYGEDETVADYKITLLANEKKYDELVKEVERLSVKYPYNEGVLAMMYAVKKNVYKDNKGALQLYEKFLENTYSYNLFNKYAEELTEQGENEKALKIKHKMAEDFPYSPNEFYKLSQYYYSVKQYDKAEEYILKSIALTPYFQLYWEQLGDVYSEQKKMPEALEAYNSSLKYDPNQYSIINKIRKLNGKKESYELIIHPDIDAVIKADNITQAKNTDYGYYFILDQKDIILHPGGAAEEYYTTLIRITNEKGVDRYKESSISYGNSQDLLIEKAEIIKKNGTKLEGEKSNNEIVFTNLEAGDIVVYKYRLRSYVYGRLAKHYWDRYQFGGQIYSATTRYNILVPDGLPFYFVFNNHKMQPVVTQVENFKKHSWEIKQLEPDKDEPLMPPLTDVAATLHVSTISSWNEIANWYSDISNTKAEENFEITALFKQLFPDTQKKLTQFEKAKIIYDHIQSNISYSSVAFRQSAFVPQLPSVTLTTRLGDCKDLSSLFVTLAHMAGINSQLVLLDTRDNGEKRILLPSVEFNHCVVKAELDNKNYYLELTDNHLPFASLPNNDIGAVILEIPYKTSTDKAGLKFLQTDNRKKDISKRVMEITPVESNLLVSVQSIKYGTPSSNIRSMYLNLDIEKLLLEFEKLVAGKYKNNIKIQSGGVKNLDQLYDSVEYHYSYIVKNEIAEIGSIKTFRIVYPDVVATLDKFSADSRSFPIEYWSYEDVDQYETVVTVTAPSGTKFIELPATEKLYFNDMKFSLEYILKSPGKLIIVRKFSGLRKNVTTTDYPRFKNFFEKIVKAEQKFIAYK